MAACGAPLTAVLGDPRLRRELVRTIQRRVHPTDVDDVVQTTLAEALAAKALPSVDAEVRRFVFAIAWQKVADAHRRRGREQRRRELLGAEARATAPEPSNDVERWLARVLPSATPDAERTLEWMVRESEGETLAEIAEAARVSPAMVRQRVSRLRRWLRARWTKDTSIVLVLALVAIGLALGVARRPSAWTERARPTIDREPLAPPPDSEPKPAPEPDPEPALLMRPPKIDPMPWRKRPPGARTAPSSASPPTACPAPCASIATRTLTTRSSTGTTTIERTVDVTLPRIDVRTCATPSSRRGIGDVAVTFLPSGAIAAVDVTGPFTPSEIACVQRLYGAIHARAFGGEATTAHAYIALVPDAPPAWAVPSP